MRKSKVARYGATFFAGVIFLKFDLYVDIFFFVFDIFDFNAEYFLKTAIILHFERRCMCRNGAVFH